MTALFFLVALLILAIEVALFAEIRVRRNWPRDDLEADVFIDEIRAAKAELVDAGIRMGGSR